MLHRHFYAVAGFFLTCGKGRSIVNLKFYNTNLRAGRDFYGQGMKRDFMPCLFFVFEGESVSMRKHKKTLAVPLMAALMVSSGAVLEAAPVMPRDLHKY